MDKIEFEQELEDGKEEGEEGEEGEEDDGGDTCEKSAEEELELVRTKEHVSLPVLSGDVLGFVFGFPGLFSCCTKNASRSFTIVLLLEQLHSCRCA